MLPLKTKTLLATAALGLAVAPVAHGETTLSAEQRPFTVSTYQDRIAWSSYDAQAGDYVLKLLSGSPQAQTVPVAASTAPFDVDLGTSRTGRLVAVYSRDGRIFEFNTATGRETDTGLRGREPTVLAGRFAYVRRSHGRDVLYLKKSARSPERAVFTAARAKGSGIQDPELSGSHLAFVTAAQPQADRGLRNVRVQTLPGRSKVVYSARSGGANFADVVSPSFDLSGRHLYWARTNEGAGGGNRFVRLTLSTGRLAYATGSVRIQSTGWLEPGAGFASEYGLTDGACAEGPDLPAGEQPGCKLVLSGPVSFTAKP